MPVPSGAFDDQPMTCAQCIERASEYIDEALDPIERARQAGHLAACSACARYHRVLVQSLGLVRELPSVTPSADFTVRLNRRLRSIEDQQLLHQQSVIAGASVTIVVAAVIAFIAWAPILREAVVPAAGGAVATAAAEEQPVVIEASEGEDVRYPMGLSPYMRPSVSPPTSLTAAFPGPYSPLVVEPPAVGRSRNSRAVLATFYSVE